MRLSAIALGLLLASPAAAQFGPPPTVPKPSAPLPGKAPLQLPDWISSSCCGSEDSHRLAPEQVTDAGDYYIIVGYPDRLPKYVESADGTREPNPRIRPSQDGFYWAFYAQGPQFPSGFSPIWCFFAPLDF